MSPESQSNTNRLIAVGAGTIIWVSFLKAFLPGFNLLHGLMIAVWIAMGSRHFARAFVDFERPLRLKIAIGLALMSPGWPVWYLIFVRKLDMKIERE